MQITMFRLMLLIFALVATAATLLHFRNERLRTRHEIALAHTRMQQLQARLWEQQVEIAAWTSPGVLQQLTGTEPPDPTPEMEKLVGKFRP